KSAIAATPRIRVSLRMLLSRLHLGSHQTDFIDTGAMRDIDRLRDPHEVQARVALYEDDALGAGFEDFLKPVTKLFFRLRLIVDRVVVLLVDDNDYSPLIRLIRLLVGGRRLGHERLESFGGQGRDHHEDDD